MSRRAIIALLVGAAVALSGCGSGEGSSSQFEAQTEGIYLTIGGLTYQVQMSRYLNPGDVEDAEYLNGLPEGIPAQLPGDETWFGIWMRVKNYSEEPLTPTSSFTIVDTEENEFRPVPLDAGSNPFVYEPKELRHAQVLPTPDTAAATGPIQGALILFRLTTESLQNRPLKLHIEQGGSQTGIIDIDL